jgi:hypothetical protein
MHPSLGRFRRLRDHLQAREDGRRDGLRGIPAAHGSMTPPALVRIAQRATEELAQLSRVVIADEVHQRQALSSTQRERRSADDDVERAAVAVAEAGRHSEASVERRDAIVPGERGPRVGGVVYLLGIVAILIAEFPLNAIAFRLFGEAEVLTWVMTASLAVTLVLCAHGLGTFLRQAHPSMAERRWIVVLIALPILAIAAIAVIRARYLSYEAELTRFDALGPMIGSAVFLVINLLVYTGATMLSYLAHAPRDVAAERAGTAVVEADRDLELAQRRLAEASRRVGDHEERSSKAAVAAEESVRVAAARADEVIAYHRGLMATYCTANLRARKDADVVEAFEHLPEIRVPAVLEEIARPNDGAVGNGKASTATVDELTGVAR